jgi:hypothetical protein
MRRAALGAGHTDVSQTRSSSLPTRVKDVVTRAAASSYDLQILKRSTASTSAKAARLVSSTQIRRNAEERRFKCITMHESRAPLLWYSLRLK